jgi:hypothetical protein
MQPQRADGDRADVDATVSGKPTPLPAGRVGPISFDSAAPSSVMHSSADEIAQLMLGLVVEMEASLQGSQKAVLASDGLGLENCTREQVRLHRALELLLWPRAWPGTAVQEAAQKSGGPPCAPDLAAELLAAERRVLHATRVQAALLRRARQFQRILANFAAARAARDGAWPGQSTQF